MIEYPRSDYSKLQIPFTAASGITSVVFEAYDLDSNEFIQAGNAASSGSLIFNATLNEDSTEYDRNIKMEWISSTASGASSTIEYLSIIRPYATPTRIRSIADIDSSVTDTTLKKLERRARLTIDSIIKISFTKTYKSVVAYGNNSDVLMMPEPIIRIDKIYEDDILVYDSVSTASVNEFDFPLEKSVSRFRIKAVNSDNEDERRMLESPDYAILPYSGIFKKDYQYHVVGVFGYSYVPSKIEEATSLLVEDYLCNDSNIRNKNIETLKTDSYDIKYGSNFAAGTGNLIVDRLLSDYYYEIKPMVL